MFLSRLAWGISVTHTPAEYLPGPDERVRLVMARVLPRLLTTWGAFCLLGGVGLAAEPAESVRWRSDYAEARREAAEKGRPMVLQVVKDNCLWCQKMDT